MTTYWSYVRAGTWNGSILNSSATLVTIFDDFGFWAFNVVELSTVWNARFFRILINIPLAIKLESPLEAKPYKTTGGWTVFNWSYRTRRSNNHKCNRKPGGSTGDLKVPKPVLCVGGVSGAWKVSGIDSRIDSDHFPPGSRLLSSSPDAFSKMAVEELRPWVNNEFFPRFHNLNII